MGNELRYVCLVETRRLLLLMGAVFGLILFVQYFELPYVGVLSSVFETSKSRVATIEDVSSRDSWSRTSSDVNATEGAPTAADEINGNTGNVKDGFIVESEKTPNVDFGDDFGVENGKTLNDTTGDDFVLESGQTLNDTFGDDFGMENGKALNDTLDDGFDTEEEIPLKDSLEMDRDSTIDTAVRNDVEDTDDGLQELEETSRTNASFKDDGIGDVVQVSERIEEKNSTGETPLVAQSPSSLLSNFLPPQNQESSRFTSTETSPPNASIAKEPGNILPTIENPKIPKKERFIEPELAVVPISKMNDMLLESHLSYQPPVFTRVTISYVCNGVFVPTSLLTYFSVLQKIRWSSPADNQLRSAKFQIENAPLIHDDPEFDVSLYRNFSAFKR